MHYTVLFSILYASLGLGFGLGLGLGRFLWALPTSLVFLDIIVDSTIRHSTMNVYWHISAVLYNPTWQINWFLKLHGQLINNRVFISRMLMLLPHSVVDALYTVFHKKKPVYFWFTFAILVRFFIILAPVETGMNTPQWQMTCNLLT